METIKAKAFDYMAKHYDARQATLWQQVMEWKWEALFYSLKPNHVGDETQYKVIVFATGNMNVYELVKQVEL